MHVYVITNTANGKMYVGQHVGDDLESYWIRNVKYALRNYTNKTFLYRAIRKYGPESFVVESVANPTTKDEMDKLEILFIDVLSTQNENYGYNITAGGGGRLGITRPHTQEEKDHMSKIMKGRVLSEEWKKKIGDAQRGRTFSADRRKALSDSQRGKPKRRSPEHCKKISENKRQWWAMRKSVTDVVAA